LQGDKAWCDVKNKFLTKTVLWLLLLFFLKMSLSAGGKLSHEKINYIIGKYQRTMFDKEYLFYPAKSAKRLLICFSGAEQKYGKCLYSQFSWYWQDDEDWRDTAYLFLKDDSRCWYLGNEKKDLINDFSNIINHHINICKLTKDKVFTVGSSMGGYGAILYATLLGLKAAIAVNPQVDKASQKNRFGTSGVGNKWHDLDKIVALSPTVPNVSLIYGHCQQDQAACEILLDVLKKRGSTTIIRRHPSTEHAISSLVFSENFIKSEITYFENQVSFKEVRETRTLVVSKDKRID
jgi:hypothetical protein